MGFGGVFGGGTWVTRPVIEQCSYGSLVRRNRYLLSGQKVGGSIPSRLSDFHFRILPEVSIFFRLQMLGLGESSVGYGFWLDERLKGVGGRCGGGSASPEGE